MFGLNAHLKVARQNSAGVATTAATSFHPIPIISESLVTGIAELVSDGIRARYDEGPVQQGMLAVQGDVVFRPHPDLMPVVFYGLTGTMSTTAATSAQQHVCMPTAAQFDENVALVPWTIEVYKDGSANAHQYTDALLNRLTVEFVGGQLLRSSANYMARVSSEKQAAAPTFLGGSEFTWNQASISLGGVAFPHLENLTYTFDNALEFVAMLDGSQSPRRILRSGFRTLRVGGTIDIPVNSSAGLFPDFRAATERSLVATVEGAGWVSSGVNKLSMKIDVPTFRFVSWPVAVAGPGRITVAFDGRAVYNTGSAALFAVTCVNTRIGY